MNADLVETVKDIYRQAVKRVLPDTVISNSLRVLRDGRLEIVDSVLDLKGRPVYVIAFGKAACEMTAATESLLGDRVQRGIVVAKSMSDGLNLRSRMIPGSHPVPNERSLLAGASVLKFAGEIPPDALVLCLISGGGSALLEALRPEVSLEELQQTTRALLNAGASIHELNAVRARMSQIKAGGLLAALGHVEVINLIISDVLGDDLSTIASGPTVPRRASERAEVILSRYGVNSTLPDADETQYQGQPRSFVLSNVSSAIDAACDAARGQGLEPVVLSRSLTGEAREVGSTLAAIVADTSLGRTTLPRGICILAGGETTVTVRGHGVGGRNTEGALAAAIRLRGCDGVAMGFLATDGDDAETRVAGGVITGGTVTHKNERQARHALAQNDTFTFLESVGASWAPGATGTNVNDLVIGVVG